MKLILALLIFVAISSTATAKKRKRCFPIDNPPSGLVCGKNERYEKCTHLCGEKSCQNPEDRYCGVGDCQEKCLCKEGYVRDAKNNCIKPKFCPNTTTPAPVCGANEEYSECGANGCQNTCVNPTLGQVCRGMCIAGCVCKEGYLRDESGGCVKPSECPAPIPVCKANAFYSDCGTACPITCSNKDSPPQICPAVCIAGCVCEEGYILNDDGDCVLPSNCPAVEPVCPKGEVFSECGAYCQRTCGPPTPCARPPQDCNPGCVCKQGFVRETHGGKCIKQEKCPAEEPVCAKNEIYSRCGAHPGCQRSCDNLDDPLVCPRVCVPGCICTKGYVKNKDGVCVQRDECPAKPVCGKLEVWSECGANACENSCLLLSGLVACKPICNAGCICKDGYARDDNGNCIRENDCPSQQCDKNETYTTCGTACPLTCENKDDPPTICTKQCVVGCFCNKGFVRKSNGKCVRPTNC